MPRLNSHLTTAAALALSLFLPPAVADNIEQRALELARQNLLVDTHIDVPYRLHREWGDVTGATEEGDFDYPRAKAGGLNLPFMSIYTPASSEHDGSAYDLANTLIDQVEALVARAPDKFTMVTSPAEAQAAFEAGKLGLALGMENGAPIAGDLDRLRHFYNRGIRYVTLAHSESNHIGDSSYDDVRLWRGLSPFGAEVVAEMNRLGIMVDISHLSDAAAAEVLRVSEAPVIASHSSLRALVPDFERNMDDATLRALADNGGVIMINFGSSFVTPEANAHRNKFRPAAAALAERAPADDPEAFRAAYYSKHPYPFADVTDVADHIDHVVQVVGVDYVGLGSDYDGVGPTLPTGLKDVSTYPNLVAELLRRDYSEEDIIKILGGNLMRVWREVEAQAG